MVGLERLLIGRTLDGRYTIEELIGQGRGGLVYRARHPHTGVEVALKVLAAPRTPEARERFRKLVAGEVRAAAGVEHPNVAGVYCLGHDAELDLDFVTTELLRGQTLASVLSQRGKPPIALGLRLLAEAAEGLAAGHRAGLVHRDLRPASLYLVRSDAERQVRVKVAGFGVPQIVRRESLAGAAPEVSGYASPELLASGSLRLGPASDVFSLGVVGYELLTGHHPFDEPARHALAEGRTVEAEPPAEVAASVPPQVVDAVLRSLRCNPAERFADGAGFAAALQQPVRQVVAVGKLAPAAAQPAPPPAAAPAPSAEPAAEPPLAAAASVAAPAAIAAAADTAPVVDVADLAADEPDADLPDLAAAEAAASGPDAAPESAAPQPAAEASAAVAGLSAAAAVAVQADAFAAAAVESQANVAAAPAEAPAAAPIAAAGVTPPAPPRDLTRKPAPKPAAGGIGPKAPDLELYYPPRVAKPPVAAPTAFSAAPPAPPQPATPVETPAAIETPVPVVAAPTPPAPPAAAAPRAIVAETPAPQPAAEKPAVTPMPGAARRRAAAANAGGFRGSAMAAGFVLGILVLGSAAWMATRHGSPAVSAAAPLASQVAQGPAVTPSATPAQTIAGARPAESTPVAAADTANRTAEQRAADARKKAQDDERRRQEQEKARQAELLQQQQLAQQQARPGTPPPAAPQPAPAQPQPQQVAAAQPQRPAPQPSAPPPAPAPAEEAAPSAPSANTVFDEDVVEQRPQLANVNELQRALQDRYPAQLYANRVSGRVTASFVVGADGRVDPGTIRIVSSPNPGFNTPTASVLRRARFRPARVKGQAVRVQVTMPIAWTLDQ